MIGNTQREASESIDLLTPPAPSALDAAGKPLTITPGAPPVRITPGLPPIRERQPGRRILAATLRRPDSTLDRTANTPPATPVMIGHRGRRSLIPDAPGGFTPPPTLRTDAAPPPPLGLRSLVPDSQPPEVADEFDHNWFDDDVALFAEATLEPAYQRERGAPPRSSTFYALGAAALFGVAAVGLSVLGAVIGIGMGPMEGIAATTNAIQIPSPAPMMETTTADATQPPVEIAAPVEVPPVIEASAPPAKKDAPARVTRTSTRAVAAAPLATEPTPLEAGTAESTGSVFDPIPTEAGVPVPVEVPAELWQGLAAGAQIAPNTLPPPPPPAKDGNLWGHLE